MYLPCIQNESLEADIMFYKAFQVRHMLDQAGRWHNGTEVQGKTCAELEEAISKTWLQLCGPFKYLIIYGEKGVSSKDTEEVLKSIGCELKERARGQHVRMIERRGAILRHSMYCAESQFEKEGITWTFQYCSQNAVLQEIL